jgi:hypothetical protein
MLTVVETPIFIRRAEKLLSQAEHAELIACRARHPDAGDEIVGTGGVRKVRFAAGGRGKSGGFRVIYFFHDCVFRRKPASDSEPSRPPIPTDVGHPLRGSM